MNLDWAFSLILGLTTFFLVFIVIGFWVDIRKRGGDSTGFHILGWIGIVLTGIFGWGIAGSEHVVKSEVVLYQDQKHWKFRTPHVLYIIHKNHISTIEDHKRYNEITDSTKIYYYEKISYNMYGGIAKENFYWSTELHEEKIEITKE